MRKRIVHRGVKTPLPFQKQPPILGNHPPLPFLKINTAIITINTIKIITMPIISYFI